MIEGELIVVKRLQSGIITISTKYMLRPGRVTEWFPNRDKESKAESSFLSILGENPLRA
jgi:hypothetical protein